MFNVTILKMRDIVKYFFGLLLLLFIITFISKNFVKNNNENKIAEKIEKKASAISDKNLIKCVETAIPLISKVNEEFETSEDIETDLESESFMEYILKEQISSIKATDLRDDNIEEIQETVALEKGEENNKSEENVNVSPIQTDEAGVKTEVITENPIQLNYNIEYGNVKIKNQTDYELTEEMLTPNITIENKNIVLFHTHSCESYTSSEKYTYTPTGIFRTTDLNFTVTRVGGELESHLKQYGYNVIHNTNYHDYPAYNGSYTRSLETVENILRDNPSDIIIDVHRDAIGSRSDYAPIVKIGDQDIAAQIMFVIGTNNGGLWHPNWNQNLKFAIKIQEKAEELYPGLFKPIMLTKSRYNQHTGKFASIIEVGATGNTLEQCLTSMKYLAKVMDVVLK